MRWLKIATVAGVAVLAAVALGVVFLLPDAVRERSEPAPRPAEARSDAPGSQTAADAPAEPARSPVPAAPPPPDPAKSAADAARTEAFRLQASLENAGAREWGAKTFETSFPAALDSLAKANDAYERRDFATARDSYEEASDRLRTLERNRPERLRTALERAEAAMRAYQPEAATESFREALLLDPVNAAAEAGIERARKLRRAMDLASEGRKLVEADDLPAAVQTLRSAVEADPGYIPAKAALAAAETELERRRFAAEISRASAALEAGKLGDAKQAVDAAGKLRPGDPAYRDLRSRLDVAVRNDALTRLQAEGRRLQAKEAWKEAVETYKRALGIDANAGFAVDGLRTATRFAELHDQIDFYLAQPGRLQSARPLDHAKSVLAAAAAVEPAGVSLQEKRDKLREVIAAAQVPVPVTLVSDGQTSVTVYRIARLGTFAERRLDLVPGEYTVVGTRAGYRDVRLTVTVPQRSPGVTVQVQCREPI